MLYSFVEALWFILPAYAANGLAPLVRFFPKRHPIDFGKRLAGRPVFGKSKTWEGFLIGIVLAGLIGWIQQIAYPWLPWELSPVQLDIIPMSPLLGLWIGFGAMSGDLFGSFLKRRFGLKPGDPAPLLDQLDFVFGSLLSLSLFFSIKPEWILWLVVLTPLLHWISSFLGFRLKLKSRPW